MPDRLEPDLASPDWEPLDRRIKVGVTRSFAHGLAAFADELGVAQSIVVREACRRGLPALIADARFLREHGYAPGAYLQGVATGHAFGEGAASRDSTPQWVSTPVDDAGLSSRRTKREA